MGFGVFVFRGKRSDANFGSYGEKLFFFLFELVSRKFLQKLKGIFKVFFPLPYLHTFFSLSDLLEIGY